MNATDIFQGGPFDGLDLASARLMVQLQLNDILTALRTFVEIQEWKLNLVLL